MRNVVRFIDRPPCYITGDYEYRIALCTFQFAGKLNGPLVKLGGR